VQVASPFDRRVIWVGGIVFAVLMALSGRYGFDRDELYFLDGARHLQVSYVDQPVIAATLSNPYGIHNQEWGGHVYLCTAPATRGPSYGHGYVTTTDTRPQQTPKRRREASFGHHDRGDRSPRPGKKAGHLQLVVIESRSHPGGLRARRRRDPVRGRRIASRCVIGLRATRTPTEQETPDACSSDVRRWRRPR
jgi:hypothetical protein